MSDDEIEELRQRFLDEMGDDFVPDEVSPGSFGCHEALHMADFLMESVDRSLLGHPAVVQNPAWFELAYKAHQALFQLYQDIGIAHLEADDDEPPPEGAGTP
ncbi:hypothetical protein [Pararhodospirillum oryzae]|uniref:Uncharacterized protein n=1 Tax=Pararhodospirillum oryzae TaxID=478448 RepID=A0A512H672_9PROT|nr:hypothetical protein [Pararhodospirillum oryzae]GEO80941.1 hypothetical protein ROR02_10720 [Pararhodospirillum oryzae]